MKASLLPLAVLWVGAAVAQGPDSNGGPPPGPGHRHESPAERLDHLATLLDLTDAQKAQVESILKDEHARMQAQREQSEASGQRPTFEQMKAAHAQAQADTIAKLTPVLSAVQLKKFQVLLEERGLPGGPH